MKAMLSGTVLLAALLVTATLVAAAPASPVAPAAAQAPAWPYTLYGDAVSGWGLTGSSISKPGPTLVVTTGEALDLHLYSEDGASHTWFVDTNNNSAADAGEPISPIFNLTTGATWYNFTATLAAGTYTYRCGIHPGSMWGELVVQAAPTFTLWGSAATPNGWGLTADTITYPGPTLNVSEGQTVSVDLFSADGAGHTFYVDFAKSGSTSGNTVSAVFNGSHATRFTFLAGSAGNFTYACGIHGQASMKGVLHVAAVATPPPPQVPDYALYAAAILVIVVIAIVAVILIRRRPGAPPSQPPANPPSG